MENLEGKKIKIVFNHNGEGWAIISGEYISKDNNFIVIKNDLNNKVEYICLHSVKYFEAI